MIWKDYCDIVDPISVTGVVPHNLDGPLQESHGSAFFTRSTGTYISISRGKDDLSSGSNFCRPTADDFFNIL